MPFCDGILSGGRRGQAAASRVRWCVRLPSVLIPRCDRTAALVAEGGPTTVLRCGGKGSSRGLVRVVAVLILASTCSAHPDGERLLGPPAHHTSCSCPPPTCPLLCQAGPNRATPRPTALPPPSSTRTQAYKRNNADMAPVAASLHAAPQRQAMMAPRGVSGLPPRAAPAAASALASRHTLLRKPQSSHTGRATTTFSTGMPEPNTSPAPRAVRASVVADKVSALAIGMQCACVATRPRQLKWRVSGMRHAARMCGCLLSRPDRAAMFAAPPQQNSKERAALSRPQVAGIAPVPTAEAPSQPKTSADGDAVPSM
eukprot:363493-Chlamydomonas_euryale.AAC.3